MDHLDRRCDAGNDPGETLCERMLFATDQIYGRGEQVARSTESFATFIEGFFRNAGGTYLWGTKGDTVLSGTARRIMAEVQIE